MPTRPPESTGTTNSWRDPVSGELFVDASAWTGDTTQSEWRLGPEELSGRFAIGQSRLGRFASAMTAVILLVGSLIVIVAAAFIAVPIVIDLGRGASIWQVLARDNLWGLASPFLAFVGAFGIVAGGWILSTLRRLGMRDGPALVLDDVGLEDRRGRRGKLAWVSVAEIKDISVHSRGLELEMLLVVMRQRGPMGASRTKKRGPSLRILVQSLAIDAARLKRIMEARRDAAWARAGETSG